MIALLRGSSLLATFAIVVGGGLAGLGAGCGDNGPTGTTALFALPGGTPGDDFYALPYPNDLWKKSDGTIDLTTFPTNSQIVDSYRVVAMTLDGFGLNSALYARFDGALDPTTLPASAAASIQPGAAVYLVNIDPTSADIGTRTPIIVDFRADAGGTIGANHLVARPYPGFGLSEGTTYALVITKRVHDANGAAIVAADTFSTLLAGNNGSATMTAAYAPLKAYMQSSGDEVLTDIVSAAVFTTEHTSFVVPAIRKGVLATPVPVATSLALSTEPDGTPWRLWTGMYMAPNFQSGTVPYLASGGEISVGSDGAAIVQTTENLRFALMVPAQVTMPANGWPLCIYQHGTGGDYESFVDDGTGSRLAAQGIVTISMDNVLNGARNPNGDPDADFFNFGNPYAARDNALQGAADGFSQLRLANGLSFTDNGAPIKIDPTKIMFFGHSQGGATGPGFVAFEPTLSGAVLSGTGGVLYLGLLYKTQPVNIPAAVAGFIRDNPVDEDNPSIALVQMWMERADVANFAPLLVRHPPTVDGVVNKPRNIFQTEGFIDTYAPNPGLEAMATAIGGDLVQTVDEADVPGLTQLRGRKVLTPAFSGNLNGVTAVLAQYKQSSPDSDGHFVVFEVPAAEKQAAQFLGTLAATGTATVVTP